MGFTYRGKSEGTLIEESAGTLMLDLSELLETGLSKNEG